MEPALREGDWLLVVPPRGTPRGGDIVLVRDPRERTRLLLKRVAAISSEGVVVLGDRDDHSTDSRHFGAVPLDDVVGRAAFRYAPLRRVGPLGDA
jgi:nickel-type superoxide dismutase maturation protease